jgi:peptidoglycan/xylan/chitin deacetylase (PgdA/CDA1 family)
MEAKIIRSPRWVRVSRRLGASKAASWLLEGRPIVFMYHGVAEDPLPNLKFTSRHAFLKHLEIVERDFNVVPLSDVLRFIVDGQTLPPRAVALTFDDGYRNVLEVAAPELARRGMRATIFVCSSAWHGTGGLLWFDEVDAIIVGATRRVPFNVAGQAYDPVAEPNAYALADAVKRRLKRVPQSVRNEAIAGLRKTLVSDPSVERPMALANPAELRRLEELGVELGGHTAHHVVLAAEDEDTQRREIFDDFRALTELRGGRAPIAFAYPNGRRADIAPSSLRLVREAGYRLAVFTEEAVVSRRNDPFLIPRIPAGYLESYSGGDVPGTLYLRFGIAPRRS